jgi:2-haloacid dehalogenase
MNGIKAFAFDAYGTIFDVFSVTALCEELFPGKGSALAQLWRAKQLQYSLFHSLMGRYRDFWNVTGDGLVYASKSLHLDLTPPVRKRLNVSNNDKVPECPDYSDFFLTAPPRRHKMLFIS